MTTAGPLAGIRILDLSRLLPGGFGTRILAEMGAEVIKIEAPPGGDPSRAIPPEQNGVSHHHLTVNAGKHSLCVNLKHEAGRAVFRDLAATADIVLENFRPGVADRLGIGYPTLREGNPRLVYCSLSGFGQESPLRDVPGFDLNFLALSGILSLQPPGEGGAPAIPGILMADLSAGLWTAIACLGALQARSATGRGQYLDVAMQDGAISLLTILAGRHFARPDEPPSRDFNGGSAAWNLYTTRDGRHLTLTAYDDAFWQRFCLAVSRPDLAPYGFHNPTERERILGEVRAIMQQRTLAEWETILAAHDVAFAPVLSLQEALAHPHVQARGLVQEVDHPVAGRVKQLAHPVRYGGTPVQPLAGAPALGRDTLGILRDLGYGEEQITALRAAGVIAGAQAGGPYE